jgi:hypothetical protein
MLLSTIPLFSFEGNAIFFRGCPIKSHNRDYRKKKEETKSLCVREDNPNHDF